MNDRKKNLREFQARLSERLRQAASGAAPTARLGVQVGSRRLLVELSEAGEVVPLPQTIAPVPLTRDWFRGLVNLRGSLYAVSDLARFVGDSFTPASREARLIAFAPRLGLNASVVVARMLGLQNVETMKPADGNAGGGDDERGNPAAMESAGGERPAWLGADWIDAEGRLWTELSLARLAVDDRFMAVAR
jgi:twitching motility protein PilI